MSRTPDYFTSVDKSDEIVLLLDTSAFILGYDLTDADDELYTVPSVREELREGELARLRFESAVRNGRLKLVKPDSGYLIEVEVTIEEMGEASALSETDSQILALGIQLKSDGLEPIVISDDYSVQNVANRLGLGFKSLATIGIRQQFEWVIYCPGCHRVFREPQPEGLCPICGTELKRRPGKKKKIK
ncbi:MAG: NOB1 family endonuclease [Candidatus Bathyarchaeia archaeon]